MQCVETRRENGTATPDVAFPDFAHVSPVGEARHENAVRLLRRSMAGGHGHPQRRNSRALEAAPQCQHRTAVQSRYVFDSCRHDRIYYPVAGLCCRWWFQQKPVRWCKQDGGSLEVIVKEISEEEKKRNPTLMENVSYANFLYSGYSDSYGASQEP